MNNEWRTYHKVSINRFNQLVKGLQYYGAGNFSKIYCLYTDYRHTYIAYCPAWEEGYLEVSVSRQRNK